MDMINWWRGMENALDAASLRQQVIANNIANANSPGYTAQRICFEEELQKVAASSGNDDLNVKPVSLGDSNESEVAKFGWRGVHAKMVSTDQKVDVHTEMANLAKNQLYYNMVADKIGGMMKGLMNIVDQMERR